MFIEKPTFHQLTQEALDELTRAGITPTPDEIVWLNHAAKEYVQPGQDAEALIMDFPLTLGRVELWTLSIGAMLWIKRHAQPLAEKSERMRILIHAFAMAHSRQPHILHQCTSAWRIEWRVFYWAAGVGVTFQALSAAVDQMLGNTEYVDIEAVNAKPGSLNSVQWGDIVATLCHHYPATKPEYWLWETSEDEAIYFLTRIHATSSEPGANQDSKSFRAFGRFRSLVAHIKRLHAPDDLRRSPEPPAPTPDAEKPPKAQTSA